MQRELDDALEDGAFLCVAEELALGVPVQRIVDLALLVGEVEVDDLDVLLR